MAGGKKTMSALLKCPTSVFINTNLNELDLEYEKNKIFATITSWQKKS